MIDLIQIKLQNNPSKSAIKVFNFKKQISKTKEFISEMNRNEQSEDVSTGEVWNMFKVQYEYLQHLEPKAVTREFIRRFPDTVR